jgi:hypothetical protein
VSPLAAFMDEDYIYIGLLLFFVTKLCILNNYKNNNNNNNFNTSKNNIISVKAAKTPLLVLDVVYMDRGPNRGRGLELPKSIRSHI